MSDAGAVVGFRPPGSWDPVLPLTECHLLDSGIEAVRATVEGWLRDKGLAGWNPRTGEGFARHLLARSSQGGQELLVSLVDGRRRAARPPRAWSSACARAHPAAGGHRPRGQHRPRRAQCRPPLHDALGRPYLLEKLAGLTLKVSLDAFFQTNTLMAERLYGLVARRGARLRRGRGRRRRPGAGPVIWDLCSEWGPSV